MHVVVDSRRRYNSHNKGLNANKFIYRVIQRDDFSEFEINGIRLLFECFNIIRVRDKRDSTVVFECVNIIRVRDKRDWTALFKRVNIIRLRDKLDSTVLFECVYIEIIFYVLTFSQYLRSISEY